MYDNGLAGRARARALHCKAACVHCPQPSLPLHGTPHTALSPACHPHGLCTLPSATACPLHGPLTLPSAPASPLHGPVHCPWLSMLSACCVQCHQPSFQSAWLYNVHCSGARWIDGLCTLPSAQLPPLHGPCYCLSSRMLPAWHCTTALSPSFPSAWPLYTASAPACFLHGLCTLPSAPQHAPCMAPVHCPHPSFHSAWHLYTAKHLRMLPAWTYCPQPQLPPGGERDLITPGYAPDGRMGYVLGSGWPNAL